MLDQRKLIVELEKNADQLFINKELSWSDTFGKQWDLLSEDRVFLQKLQKYDASPWPIPLWQGCLNEVIKVSNSTDTYTIFSVDGSQIYPERHVKSYCFLINIGMVYFSYKTQASSVNFETVPLVYPLIQETDGCSVDIINGIRHEQELAYGFEKAKSYNKDLFWLLFDGSFIFWHLDLQKGLKERFLSIYLNHLLDGYAHKIPSAAYISDPKSKELVSILRLFLCDFNVDDIDSYADIKNMVDAVLVQSYVPVGYRTTVFQNRSPISFAYPLEIRPHFFYINLGKEVARVEFPAWIAKDLVMIDALAACIKDQVQKGDGYPIILAEAHEQAVIKSADRDLFYNCLERVGQRHDVYFSMKYSQKLIKKKMIKI